MSQTQEEVQWKVGSKRYSGVVERVWTGNQEAWASLLAVAHQPRGVGQVLSPLWASVSLPANILLKTKALECYTCEQINAATKCVLCVLPAPMLAPPSTVLEGLLPSVDGRN